MITFSRIDGTVLFATSNIIDGSYSLTKNETSPAFIELPGCLPEYRLLEKFSTIVNIDDRWAGVLVSLEDTADSLILNFQDYSFFTKRASLQKRTKSPVDVSVMIQELFEATFIDGFIDYDVTPTGMTVDYEYAENFMYVYDKLQDLSDNGADWFMVGNTLYVYPTGSVLEEININGFTNPTIFDDGTLVADRIIAYNDKGNVFVGEYRDGTEYGVGTILKQPLTRIFYDTNLQTTEALADFAQGRNMALQEVIKVNLNGEIPLYDFTEPILPSTRVTFDTSGYCLDVSDIAFEVTECTFDLIQGYPTVTLESLGDTDG